MLLFYLKSKRQLVPMLHIVGDHQEKNKWVFISCKRDLHLVGIGCKIKAAGVVLGVFHLSGSAPEGGKVKPITWKESARFRSILGTQT